MLGEISLYIPVYNGEKTIKRAINSILNQSLKPKDILIINDCSTDNTMNEIKNINEIKIINNKTNFGLAKSRNIGLLNSNYDYVASIDSDVECDRCWLENLYKKMVEKDYDLIGGKLVEKNIESSINKWRAEVLKQNWGDVSFQNPDFVFGANSLLNKKKILEKKILYDENFKTNGEDVNFSRTLKKSGFSLFYESNAICYHLQLDDINSISERYWRYNFYGAGIKKVTFLRKFRLIIRQIKKFISLFFKHLFLKKYDFLTIDFYITKKFILNIIKK